MIPSSTAVLTAAAAAASLLLGPALATSSSQPDHIVLPTGHLNPDHPVQWHQAKDAKALQGYPVKHETAEDEGDEGASGYTVPASRLITEGRPDLEQQAELRRWEDEVEGRGAVLVRRETSAAPTIFGFSIWLIIAWLILLYLMYNTGSMF
jgi:hypothetical protein